MIEPPSSDSRRPRLLALLAAALGAAAVLAVVGGFGRSPAAPSLVVSEGSDMMVQIASVRISSWDSWYGNASMYFAPDAPPAYPPEQFFAQREVFFVKMCDDGETRLFSLLFFEAPGLPAMQAMFDPATSPLVQYGVDAGWLIPPFAVAYENADAVGSVTLVPGAVVPLYRQPGMDSIGIHWPEGMPSIDGAQVKINCDVDEAGAYQCVQFHTLAELAAGAASTR